MDHYSILDHTASTPAPATDAPKEPASQVSASISAGQVPASGVSVRDTTPTLASPTSPSLRRPAEDGGGSLLGMAQRDLDAALQLLAERAQYITSASGAAIALRRSSHNDMLCRASAGSNAPALGTLLSAESGLSGESVRTRQPLRCDDAESDPRVNRQSCRELGIASVMVIPIVSEDQVLGVFELFSGRPNAFDERDIAALQRLGQMVETAVMHALAAAVPVSAETVPGTALSSDNPPIKPTIEIAVEASAAQAAAPTKLNAVEAEFTGNSAAQSAAERLVQPRADSQIPTAISASASVLPHAVPNAVPDASATAEDLPVPQDPAAVQPTAAFQSSPTKKIIWWSAPTPDNSAVQPQAQISDPIPVPPALKGVHRCQACGFPVSEGRVLCVECEEKKWRGTPIPKPQPTIQPPTSSNFNVSEMPSSSINDSGTPRKSSQTNASRTSVHSPVTAAAAAETAVPGFVLSAGAEPSQSWLAANMYVIAAMCVVAIVIAMIAWVR